MADQVKGKVTVDTDMESPITPEEAEKLEAIYTESGGAERASLMLLRACMNMACDVHETREALRIFDEAKAGTGDDSVDEDDLDRLDWLDVNRSFEDIMNYWLQWAGGDPMLALRRLVRRGMVNDNELEEIRLALHDQCIFQGLSPILHDADRRREFLDLLKQRITDGVMANWRIEQAASSAGSASVQ